MAIRITESQLRQIVRQEARRLVEAGGFVRPGPDISDPDVDHFADLSDPYAVAQRMIGDLGADEVADILRGVMDGDHTADAEFQEHIEAFSDGVLDGGDVQTQNEVIDALNSMLE